MSRGEFYKMEYDSWDEGTVDLTLEEEAAYLRLCHQMYRRRGPIPKSERLLVALWRCHINKARHLLDALIAKGKIQVTTEGDLTNTRVTREVHARETLRTQRAHAAHTGGIRSGEVRRKSKENNTPTELFASTDRSIEERRGEEIREERKKETADAASKPPDAKVYDLAREMFGKKGGQIATQLIRSKKQNFDLCMAALHTAQAKSDPSQYIWGVIRKSAKETDDRYADLDPRVFLPETIQ